MSKQISFRDANGRRVSGCFEVSHGIITVIASDGRMKTSILAVLGPETLAIKSRAGHEKGLSNGTASNRDFLPKVRYPI